MKTTNTAFFLLTASSSGVLSSITASPNNANELNSNLRHTANIELLERTKNNHHKSSVGPLQQCSANSDTIKSLLDEHLRPVLESYADAFPWPVQVSFYGKDNDQQPIEWDFAGGYANWTTREKMTSDHLIAGGSTTKPITATAIMQHIAMKTSVTSDVTKKPITITLDTTVNHFINDLLSTNMDGHTMETLFPSSEYGGKEWGSIITVRHLLEQTSCIADYDDGWSLHFMSCNSTSKITPYDFIRNPDGGAKTLLTKVPKVCKIGEAASMSYSGIGYILLGLILTKLNGHKEWYEYDQMSMFPSSYDTDGVAFSRQSCTEFGPNVAGQYYFGGNISQADTPPKVFNKTVDGPIFADLGMDGNCLNGWTMGNGAYSAKFYAKFKYDLYTGGLPLPNDGNLDMTFINEMVPLKCELTKNSAGNIVPKNPETYRSNGCFNSAYPQYKAYGFGAMLDYMGSNLTSNELAWDYTIGYGHGGMDYASGGFNDFFTNGAYSFAMFYKGSYDYDVNWGVINEEGKCGIVESDSFAKTPPSAAPLAMYFTIVSFMNQICLDGSLSLESENVSSICGPDDPGCHKSAEWILGFNSSSILDCIDQAGGIKPSADLFGDADETCEETLSNSTLVFDETDYFTATDYNGASYASNGSVVLGLLLYFMM